MSRPKSKRRPRKSPRSLQVLSLGGLVLLIAAILFFKEFTQAETPAVGLASGSEAQSAQSLPGAGNPEDLPEAQLERALQAGMPTLAFFHSNNCRQCIDMIATVNLVYPEFADKVTLVDINVYDEHNADFVMDARIQYIPTLYFYDRSGQEQVTVGVMEAEQLRQTLAALAGE
jgi:thioredoxin-like negative regulator of GroEL